MRCKMSSYGWGFTGQYRSVLMRCKCMHTLESMIVLSCFGVYDCLGLVIRFHPTSRIVSRLYRERTMEKLRTNEEVKRVETSFS